MLLVELESWTVRRIGFLQSFSPNPSISFLENQGHGELLLIPLILFLEHGCPSGGTQQRGLSSQVLFTLLFPRPLDLNLVSPGLLCTTDCPQMQSPGHFLHVDIGLQGQSNCIL